MRTMFDEEFGDRPGVRNMAIVITDGNSTVDVDDLEPEAEGAQDDDDIFMLSVGITPNANEDELRILASNARINVTYWMSPSFTDLSGAVVEQIVEGICVEPGPTTLPPTTLAPGTIQSLFTHT